MSKSIQIWDHLFPLVFPKDSENLKSWTSGSGEKKTFKWSEQRKKKKISNFWPFLSKNVQIWDHFFLLFFSKNSESLRILHIRLREVGAIRRLHGTSKSELTNTQKSEQIEEKKLVQKTFFAATILDHFLAKIFRSETTSFHYFSQRILNVQKFWTSDFGKLGQKDVYTVPQKVNRQTQKDTDRRTDTRTFWLVKSFGPEGRYFENLNVNVCNPIVTVKQFGSSQLWDEGKISMLGQ